ncbi:MAG: EFR1 family ferrodoxin [Anaeromicrobium sp.]|uniref:EFR1 family ferrodoxin n=1 Tax=Anaeromicrobium sp. TaxID=1929132 RepID=UPI0025D27E94|nr:EFR1 family ferrodoxin [Anaeromicrobium sp.]MCT4596049.1 EFR1 family ferrodoxin [Anaeromicrobium sp.]
MISLKENTKNLSILIAFFSATGNTKKISNVIQKKLHDSNILVTMLDITSYASRKEEILLNQYDAVVFGFPIYSMRAPRVCREWLETLDGKGMKCSVFFTYGGFGKDPAHYFIKKLLEKQNFKLVSTAEFLGAHTFNRSGWKAVIDRPNQSDFEVAQDYVMKTVRRFLGDDLNELGEFEKPMYDVSQFDQAEKYRFSLITKLPTKDSKNCSMCGLCEKLCPVNAMNMQKGIADNRCIACFRCIVNCPDGILHTNDLSDSWDKKLKMHKMTKEEVDNLKSKIYL